MKQMLNDLMDSKENEAGNNKQSERDVLIWRRRLDDIKAKSK